MILRLIFLVLCMPISIAAQTIKADPQVVKSLEEKLKKVESSIDVTRKRLNSQRETRFAPDLFFTLGELLRDRSSLSSSLKREKNPGVPEAELDFSLEKKYTQEAIENFKLIEDRYPKYESMDRVLFTLASEYNSLGDDKTALNYFKKITENFPQSESAAKAFLEIGSIFYQKKDFEYALKNFDEALNLAKGTDRLKVSLKRGESLSHLDRWMESLKSFESVYLQKGIGSNEDEDLKEQALIASVLPLLELNPAQTLQNKIYQDPIEYYRKASKDKGRFRRVLNRLYQRLEIKKRNRESVLAALELFKLSDSLQERKEAFEFAYLQIKKQEQMEFPEWLPHELYKLISWIQKSESPKKRKEELARYEPVYRDIITNINSKALSTARAEDLQRVTEYYRQYFSLYSTGKHIGAMKVNEAEALFLSGQSSLAGQAYWSLAKSPEMKDPKKRRELIESALEAFLKPMSDETSKQLDLLQARDGYREVGSFFIKSYSSDPKVPEIEYNISRTYYDERDFDTLSNRALGFLKKYPSHDKAKATALLYLDCYYLRGQMKEMSQAGSTLLKMKGLTADTRSVIAQASQQAQMKALQSLAGDYGTKDYALKFREFARQNKNSKLGENALFEAFNSLRAKLDQQAYSVGEEYVGTYGKSQRVKEVILSLTQLSLILVDYQRAASYMASFAQMFPSDAEAKKLSHQAAVIYEYSGQVNQAVEAYKMAGDFDAALKVLFKFGLWGELNQLAAKVPGLTGQYYQGVSMIRRNQKDGVTLLDRVARSQGGTPREREMVGHAAILLGEIKLNQFRGNSTGQTFSAPLLQAKAAEYQDLTQLFQAGVASGGGSWVVGGLYNLAILNQSFAQFLNSLNPPAGMPAAQLKQVLSSQIQSYLNTSKESRLTCLKVAEENEVISQYVKGCASASPVKEAQEFALLSPSRSPAGLNTAVQNAIKKNPRSPELLRQGALAEIKSGRYLTALLILSRAAEISASESLNESYMGAAYLHMKDFSSAHASFKSALAKNPKDGVAIRGLASLAKNFGLKNKAKFYEGQISGTQSVSGLHPWLN